MTQVTLLPHERKRLYLYIKEKARLSSNQMRERAIYELHEAIFERSSGHLISIWRQQQVAPQNETDRNAQENKHQICRQ
ncbi:hypothetical protein EJB05_29202, partial [Eragrostis curvula]